MILAIDFDGTIHDPYNRIGNYKMGQPIPGAFEALSKFRSKGFRIIVHTVWARNSIEKKVISDWLNYFKIPFDEVTSQKPLADYYIDDKAIKFEGWDKITI